MILSTFSYAYWPCGYLLSWSGSSSLLPIFKFGCPFLKKSICRSPLSILDANPMSNIYIVNDFSHMWFAFHPLNDIFNQQEFLILINSIYQSFHLWSVIFVSCLRNLCISHGHEDILLFSSGSLFALPFIFISLIHLELVLLYYWSQSSLFFILIPNWFIKEYLFTLKTYKSQRLSLS